MLTDNQKFILNQIDDNQWINIAFLLGVNLTDLKDFDNLTLKEFTEITTILESLPVITEKLKDDLLTRKELQADLLNVEDKIWALRQHLEGEEPDPVHLEELVDLVDWAYSIERCGDYFHVGSKQYLVLKDADADELAKTNILDFFYNLLDEVPKELQNYVDKNSYIQDVLDHDGRGHVIATYDGEEHEIDYEGCTYYIYRMN